MARKLRQIAAMRTDGAGGRGRLEVTDPAALRARIGDDVLTAFACCFAHADRLTTLLDVSALSLMRHGPRSVAHDRNVLTKFCFSVGTLHELAMAVNALRGALQRARLLAKSDPAWRRLGWLLRGGALRSDVANLRNTIAFHVSDRTLRAGIARLLSRRQSFVIARWDGSKPYAMEFPLGMEAARTGMGLTPSRLRRKVSRTAMQQVNVAQDLRRLFVDTLKRSGLGIARTEGEVGQK